MHRFTNIHVFFPDTLSKFIKWMKDAVNQLQIGMMVSIIKNMKNLYIEVSERSYQTSLCELL